MSNDDENGLIYLFFAILFIIVTISVFVPDVLSELIIKSVFGVEPSEYTKTQSFFAVALFISLVIIFIIAGTSVLILSFYLYFYISGERRERKRERLRKSFLYECDYCKENKIKNKEVYSKAGLIYHIDDHMKDVTEKMHELTTYKEKTGHDKE